MHETELQRVEAMIAEAAPDQLAALSFAIHARLGELGTAAEPVVKAYLDMAEDSAPDLFRTAATGVAIAAKLTADLLWPPLTGPVAAPPEMVRRVASAAGNDRG